MGRYVRRFSRVGHSLGPSEERGFSLWAGYDIEGVEDDLSHLGFTRADEIDLSAVGVTSFLRVAAGDAELRKKLGLATEE